MTAPLANIIKSRGMRPSEHYDRAKLHRSLKLTLLSERSHDGEADNTADKVCTGVERWLRERPEVTSHDLRRIASKHLTRYNPGAAYIYEHHRHTI